LKPGDRQADEQGQYPTLEQVSLIAVRHFVNPNK
jgi:hypothetical protein